MCQGRAYLQHHSLQHQPARLLQTAVRAARALLHAAVRIGTRAAGMVRTVRASAVERFQAVGQSDADHGRWKKGCQYDTAAGSWLAAADGQLSTESAMLSTDTAGPPSNAAQ